MLLLNLLYIIITVFIDIVLLYLLYSYTNCNTFCQVGKKKNPGEHAFHYVTRAELVASADQFDLLRSPPAEFDYIIIMKVVSIPVFMILAALGRTTASSFCNVKDYGAKGDGVSNDTQPFVEAFQACKGWSRYALSR